MRKSTKNILLFFLFASLFLASANFSSALEFRYPTILGNSINETSTLPEFVRYLFNVGLILGAFIAVVITAFGGIHYLIDYASGKFKDEGMDWIKAGISGLLLVFLSYLIAYTINPSLVFLKLTDLPSIIGGGSSNPFLLPGVNKAVYEEIPIGTLTENVLTRTTDCYTFNPEGNPIDGDQIRTDNGRNINGPTYLNRDRIQCLSDLLDGAQKKAKIINDLSNEIKKLMDSCKCTEDKCQSTCNKDSGCTLASNQKASGQGTECVGSAFDSYSKDQKDSLTLGDCKRTNPYASCNPAPNGPPDCCPTGVKDKIEHGPVKVGGVGGSGSSCGLPEKDYKGLDEFRCPAQGLEFQQCSGIGYFVEKQEQINGKIITIIDQEKWRKLNLVQQLTYFKEKAEQFKESIKKDAEKLDQAKNAISSKQCYLMTPYVDLLKTQEQTDQKNTVILTVRTFQDPQTGTWVDSSKYCQGFNYSNSSCYNKCNAACPDNTKEALSCYKDAKKCDPGDQKCLNEQEIFIEKCFASRPCPYGAGNVKDFQTCINNCQDDCTNNCKKEYSECSPEFKVCQNLCQDNSMCVLDKNPEKCLFGAGGFQQCANQITDQGNSQYCLNNSYRCKSGSDQYAGYIDCVKDIKSKNYSSSYLYTHPQDQKCPKAFDSPDGKVNAACLEVYPETSKCPASSSCPDCPCDKIDQTLTFDLSTGSTSSSSSSSGGGGGSSGSSSSSSSSSGGCKLQTCSDGTVSCNCPAFNNNSTQNNNEGLVSQGPGLPIRPGSCVPTNNPNDPRYCPGGLKCINGRCRVADCTPGQVRPCKNGGGEYCSENGYWSGCSQNSSSSSSSSGGNGGGGNEKYTVSVKAYRVVGPQCNQYSYNDDPLTFYCKDQWWLDPSREGTSNTPIGGARKCTREGEVPVGQTVDDTQVWVNNIIINVENAQDDIQKTITYLDRLGKAKDTPPVNNYCKCNAKTEDNKKICTTDCAYNQRDVADYTYDPDTGEAIPTGTTHLECSSDFVPCDGNPCQQMIDWFAKVGEYYKQLKVDYIQFYVSVLAQEGRSDILKELSYSRKQTNSCSLVRSTYGKDSRLFSCTRVKDELMPTINTGSVVYNGENIGKYCYGEELGNLFDQSLMDNWFCCDVYAKGSESNQ